MQISPFNNTADKTIKGAYRNIYHFETNEAVNIDHSVVEAFGEEWEKFYRFSDEDIEQIGKSYFSFLDNTIINKDTYVLDVGCGTGRWTKYLSGKVKFIEAIDPSKAIFYADKLLKNIDNVRLSIASTDNIPFPDETFDFVMSVGVLHHIPDTQKAMTDCVKKVKKGGFFYVYLYYAFDNRGWAFKTLFKLSDIIRKAVSSLPANPKKFICDIIAFTVYVPIVMIGSFFKFIGFKKLALRMPLSIYQDKSVFVMRNDALDRFGTSLEQRFTKVEIINMMQKAGLKNIQIPAEPIYWMAVGQKI